MTKYRLKREVIYLGAMWFLEKRSWLCPYWWTVEAFFTLDEAAEFLKQNGIEKYKVVY